MSGVADELHQAVAGVLQEHGYGMTSRLVFVVELVDDDGELGLMRGSSPWDMPTWSELGLHQYAIADIQAAVTAARQVGGDDEGSE
ncbi:hypothetical protein ACFYWS_20550 [Streptomyces sp. NPDC002795]|uniref:hypothetical protein n=1 Tax=Streptomyces sp. NPDC002795 TaxID=3364665 RepID=UPI0036C78022